MRRNVFIILFVFLSLQLNAQKLKHLKNKALPDEILKVKLINYQGDSIVLSQLIDSLKGNVVYIDFWASWCGPCIREMPKSKNLQSYFKNKPLIFVYLSTDINDNHWKSGLKRIRINGRHYRINPNDKAIIKRIFKIPGIPYYILLDKTGYIADTKAKWPHEEKLKNDIQLLLNK